MHLALLEGLIAAGKGGLPMLHGRLAPLPDSSDSLAARSGVLVLGTLPPDLHAVLTRRYALHGEESDASSAVAIVASAGHRIDDEMMTRMRALRVIVLLDCGPEGVDLGAATSHCIRVVMAASGGRSANRIVAYLDAGVVGAPMPAAIV